jgi:hypothetical protein
MGHPMTTDLLDPTAMLDKDWPAGNESLRAYVEAICRFGSERYVANVRTRIMVLRDSEFVLPVTVNNAEFENSYICSTYSIARYMKSELGLIDNRAIRLAMTSLLDGVGTIIRLVRLNKIVQVNNWLAATNPYPEHWAPTIKSVTETLTNAFPDHFICFPSLTMWGNQSLIERLVAANYHLIAFRQIYVYDRLKTTYFPHNNVQKDHRLLRRTPYRLVYNHEFEEADYPRMALLYRMLYLDKHSAFNPAFTSDYMRLCHRSGAMRFIGLRNAEGRLDGVASLFIRDHTMIGSFLGYDTTVDRRFGLYRLLVAFAFEIASAEGFNVNLSGANASFKRNRGGQPIIEYKAIYSGHLSKARQVALAAISAAANRVGVPLMKRFKV